MKDENKKLLYRFDLIFDDRLVECLVIDMKANKFRYNVEKDSQITIEAIINNQMKLIVQSDEIHSYSNDFGQLFDDKRHKLSKEQANDC